jgi:hypothetical protein
MTALTIVSWPVAAGPPARDPSDPTSAELTTAEEKVVPEEYEYVWSQAAELIVQGAVAAIETVDDPSARGAYVEATIRIDSVQRGQPRAGTLRVRVEDPFQAALWREWGAAIGSTGLWFVHRVSYPTASLPVGHLLRYVSSAEISKDPALTEMLMRYVLQDTVNQAVGKEILHALEPGSRSTRQTVDLRLGYDRSGRLKTLEFDKHSGNALFDQHVFDQVAALHRTLRQPVPIDSLIVRVSRSIQPPRNRASSTGDVRPRPTTARPRPLPSR